MAVLGRLGRLAIQRTSVRISTRHVTGGGANFHDVGTRHFSTEGRDEGTGDGPDKSVEEVGAEPARQYKGNAPPGWDFKYGNPLWDEGDYGFDERDGIIDQDDPYVGRYVPDKVKDQIYTLNRSNPKKWHARALSHAFGIPLLEIKGIISIIERNKDVTVDEDYEELLGLVEKEISSLWGNSYKRDVTPFLESKKKPNVMPLTDEEVTFEEDIMMKEFKSKKPRYVQTLKYPEPKELSTLESAATNESRPSKWKYIVKDLSVSPEDSKQVYVRDVDNTLRLPTKSERTTRSWYKQDLMARGFNIKPGYA